MNQTLELSDIQGLLVRGYGSLPYAMFVLLHIEDPAVARKLLGSWSGSLSSGQAVPEHTAMNIALTAPGITRLREEASLSPGFAEPFAAGMATPYRSRLLGDVGAEDPQAWKWGGPATKQVHALLLLYADAPSRLVDHVRATIGDAVRGGFSELAQLPTDQLSDREHFGFRDGISQPILEGLPQAANGADVVRAGEFVLGYLNEYGQRSERPLLPAREDPDRLLPRDPDGSGAADLGRNGSYLVFRQLRQDVDAFWDFVDRATRQPDGSPDPARRAVLAAKIVGRWPGGAPLVLRPDRDDPTAAEDNAFGYHTTDPLGLACPIGAHVRRTNPRDSLEPAPGSRRSRQVNRRHRILRRGRNYSGYDGGSGPERGVHFLCLNANLMRQYEFIQHSWINDPSFNGLQDSDDPLVGSRRHGRADFREPALPVRRRYADLPQFVQVRGGAYFFLPGIRALRHLTSDPRRN